MLFNNWWLIVCFSVPAINGCYSFFLIHMDKFKCKGSWRTQLCVIWLHMVNDKVMMNAAIWITIQQMFFFKCSWQISFYLKLVFRDNEDVQSDLPFPFITLNSYFGSKILGWKTSYWQKCNKHSQSTSSAHYSSPEPVGCSAMRKKKKYSVCVCVCTCAHLCVRLPRRSHVFYSCWV